MWVVLNFSVRRRLSQRSMPPTWSYQVLGPLRAFRSTHNRTKKNLLPGFDVAMSKALPGLKGNIVTWFHGCRAIILVAVRLSESCVLRLATRYDDCYWVEPGQKLVSPRDLVRISSHSQLEIVARCYSNYCLERMMESVVNSVGEVLCALRDQQTLKGVTREISVQSILRSRGIILHIALFKRCDKRPFWRHV